jgi:hypothetical protein
MSENLPTSPSPTGGEPSQSVPPNPKRRWPTSRIVLLSILGVFVLLLAFDVFHGRMPQSQAYDLLNDKLPAEKTGTEIRKDIKPLTTDDVHKLLGYLPDSTESSPAHIIALMTDTEDPRVGRGGGAPDLIETYRFCGALRAYVVRVAYKSDPKGAIQFVDLIRGTESLFDRKS